MSSLPDSLQALLYPRAYPHKVRRVDLVETHISWVLLTGKFAYKLKRPVHYPFVDLRSARQRRALCHEEVRLNRRFAPELYLDVCAIRRRHGEARIGGRGPVIEHGVRMVQFARAQQLDALLEAQRIEPAELHAFGAELARLHETLPVARAGQGWGEPAAQISMIKQNLAECMRAAAVLGDRSVLRSVQARLAAWADETWTLLAQRFAARRVRDCHGDLHAGNIVRRGTRLLPFDCLEFDPALRWIDVADEVSFLLADLDARRRPLHAHAFLEGYLTASGDYQACLLMPVFRAHRALVRAKVMALGAAQPVSRAAAAHARRSFASYVECARSALAPQRPALVLMSGLSGSGKTWLARQLAPPLRAVHLRSDIERKRLAGAGPLARSGSALAQGLYARSMTAAVYDRLADCAADSIAGGYTTIVDATFARSEHRVRFRALAASLGVNLCIVYCHAPSSVLRRRIGLRRRRGKDPSEATIEVLDWQQTYFVPPTPQEANLVLDGAKLRVPQLVRRISAAAVRG